MESFKTIREYEQKKKTIKKTCFPQLTRCSSTSGINLKLIINNKNKHVIDMFKITSKFY